MGHYASGVDGGFRGSTMRYDPTTDEWEGVTAMNIPRMDVEGATVNGRVYAIGGYNAQGFLRDVEEYDPNTNQWRVKSGMPTARDGHAVAVVNGKIYVFGGRVTKENQSDALAIFEEYNPVGDL